MVGTLTVTADQHPARVAFGVSPAPRAGQPVTFTYTGDADPDGALGRWQWDLDGDGSLRDHDAGWVGHQDLREPDDADHPHARHRRQRRAVRHRRAGRDDRGCGAGLRQLGDHGHRGPAGDPGPRCTGLRASASTARSAATATATLRAGGKTIARGSAKAGGTTTIRLRAYSPPPAAARLHRGGTSCAQRCRSPARRQWQRPKAHAQGDGAAPVGIPYDPWGGARRKKHHRGEGVSGGRDAGRFRGRAFRHSFRASFVTPLRAPRGGGPS